MRLRRSVATRSRSQPTKYDVALQPQSLLLRLPGELRNKIYQLVYSKSEDQDLCIVNNQRGYYKDVQAKIHRLLQLNSLSHTCRQMRLETAGMGRPIEHDLQTPLLHITACTITKIVWLDDHRYRTASSHTQAIENGIRYCKRFPQAKLFFMAGILSSQHGICGYLAIGAVYLEILREQALPFQMDDEFEHRVYTMVDKYRSEFTWSRAYRFRGELEICCGSTLAPANFRLYQIFKIDETGLRRSNLKKRKEKKEEWVEAWIAQIREWSENGI